MDAGRRVRHEADDRELGRRDGGIQGDPVVDRSARRAEILEPVLGDVQRVQRSERGKNQEKTDGEGLP
jgi:hypothetical protein